MNGKALQRDERVPLGLVTESVSTADYFQRHQTPQCEVFDARDGVCDPREQRCNNPRWKQPFSIGLNSLWKHRRVVRFLWSQVLPGVGLNESAGQTYTVIGYIQ